MPLPSKLQIALAWGYGYLRWLPSHWFRKLTFRQHPLGWSEEEDAFVTVARLGLSLISTSAMRVLQQWLIDSSRDKIQGLQLSCVPAATFQTPGFRDSWWISLNSESSPEKPKVSVVMMCIHGGAWRAGHPLNFCMAFQTWLQGIADKGIHARIFSVGYPLASEHRFPVPVQGVVEAYQWLVKELGGSEQIILAGDSAGGNLVMTSLEYMRSSAARACVPTPPTSAPDAAAAPFAPPLAAILISPVTDLRLSAPSSKLPDTPHDFLTSSTLPYARKLYLPEGWTADTLSSTLLSPVCMSDFGGLVQTKLLVTAGGSELLREDITGFVDKLKAGTGDLVVEYHVENDQIHCYPVLEIDELIDRGADVLVPFVSDVVDGQNIQRTTACSGYKPLC